MKTAATTAKKRILFVDDEAELLSGLECMLYRLRSTWDMSFAGGAEAAVALIHEGAFDVVVSDLHMHGLDGLGLLSEVKEHCPHAVRIILSGTADQDRLLGAAGIAHQFVVKPCSAEELKVTIQRSLALRELLTSERLMRVTARLQALPAVPALYLEMQRVLREPDSSIADVGRIVARDMAMSAKVLQLVNSAFFGLARRITSATEATTYLGISTLTALVLTEQVFAQSKIVQPERLELLWNHSLRAAAMARAIARLEGCGAQACDEAFLAGMLHDVGVLLLLSELDQQLTDAWSYASRLGLPFAECERRVIGASHAAVGAYLMGLWGLTDPVVQAIAFHHTPAVLPQQGFSALTAVHVATALDCSKEGSGFGETERELDLAYLEGLGLSARLPVWRTECARILAEKDPQ